MKLAVAVLLLAAAGPVGAEEVLHDEVIHDEAPRETCVDDGKPYDTKALGDRIALLASERLDGRAPGTDGDRAARAHIVQRMRCLGLTPAGDEGGYEQAFVFGDKKTRTANVIGFVKGTSDEIIVVSAHHDHLGGGHLGANDNASGIAAMLAIAQWVKQKGEAPARTIAFMAFGAEEEGMLGSSFYVKHPSASLPIAKVVQVINLDMVGSYSSKNYVAAMGTFTNMPSRKLLGALKATKPYKKLAVGMGGRARGSDYEPFCNVGIPYVFFWTPDAKCYHGKCDKADRIDLPHTAQISALAGDLTWAMSETETDLAASKTKLKCYGK